MTSIIYVGMDVHTTNYTLSCYSLEDGYIFKTVQVEPDYRNVKKFLARVQDYIGYPVEFITGYEAGCLGYSLYHELESVGIKCKIIAPTTIPSAAHEKKTDRRDSMKLAQCLATNSVKYVYVPTEEDLSVKEYIRMRDDHAKSLRQRKQQIIQMCHRYHKVFEGKSYWTKSHLDWLCKLDFGNSLINETFNEYLASYLQLAEKIAVFDKRIEEISQSDKYREKVNAISCLSGIKHHTALSAIVETGDFNRFPNAEKYASYLGLVPGEHSSSTDINRLGITKAGNCHLRTLLVEAAQAYGRGKIGIKSAVLKKRQEGCLQKIINYADRANTRLKRKFYRMVLQNGKKYNVATAAVARELACFIWGIMTDNVA